MELGVFKPVVSLHKCVDGYPFSTRHKASMPFLTSCQSAFFVGCCKHVAGTACCWKPATDAYLAGLLAAAHSTSPVTYFLASIVSLMPYCYSTVCAKHAPALLQPRELQPISGSGGASSAASQPFSFEALSGMAAHDRPLNSPDLGPLQVRQSSMLGSMAAPQW